MRLFNMLKYDGKGMISFLNGKRWMLLAIFSINIIYLYIQWKLYPQYMHTFGDLLLVMNAGAREYVPDLINPFKIPIEWFLLHSIVFIAASAYVTQEEESRGVVVIPLGGSRILWWLSKCFYLSLFVILYYFLIIFSSWLLSLILKSDQTLRVSEGIEEILNAGELRQGVSFNDCQWEILFMPCLVVISLLLLESVLALIIRPVYGFMIVESLLIASAYKRSSFLPGNYMMALRCDHIIQNGVESTYGVLLSVGVIIISILSGFFILRKKDILNPNKEE